MLYFRSFSQKTLDYFLFTLVHSENRCFRRKDNINEVLAQHRGALPEQRIFRLDRRVHFNAVLVGTVL